MAIITACLRLSSNGDIPWKQVVSRIPGAIQNDLKNLTYLGQTLNVENSYQYGPICIDKSVRGSGILEKIFDFSRKKMSEKYPILVTFINKTNSRSLEAHTRKLGLEVIQTFNYNNNEYYELAYDTSKEV